MLGLLLLAAGVGEALLVPMPEAKDIERAPITEHVTFNVPLTCPDSGEVLHFYQPKLEAQGYKLCGSPEVEWKTYPTITGETRSYQTVFFNEAAHKAILVGASCSLTNGRTSATEQKVFLTLLYDPSMPLMEKAYRVSCSTRGE